MADNDGFSDYYQCVTLQTSKCIEWHFPELPGGNSDNKERARRRRIKDYVGLENLDTPMLDSKMCRSGRSYCDIIMISDNLDYWQNAMCDTYESHGYNINRRTLAYGHQLSWTGDDKVIITVNFYPAESKILVHPGARDPQRLDDWIGLFAEWRNNLTTDISQIDPDEFISTENAPVSPSAPPLTPKSPSAPPLSPGVCNAPVTQLGDNDRIESIDVDEVQDNDVSVEGNGTEFNGCSQLRQSDIQAVLMNVLRLTSEFQSLAQKVEKVNNDNVRLSSENTSLRKDVADLTMRVSELSWKTFRPTNSHKDLLIGSSMIRDIDPNKLNNTTVICKSGGTIQTVTEELHKLAGFYGCITLVVGGNDCDNQPIIQPSVIVSRYNTLIKLASNKCKKLVVSSICPRLSSEGTKRQIESVNVGLLSLCADTENVTFIENTPSFKLPDGSFNDGYYLVDGIHITRAGVDKLARNFQLNICDAAEGACKDTVCQLPKTKIFKKPEEHFEMNRDFGPSTADECGQWETQRKHRSCHVRNKATRSPHDQHRRDRHNEEDNHPRLSHSQRCFFCAESGHHKKDCRHFRPVTCRLCGVDGHKAKFCYLFAK